MPYEARCPFEKIILSTQAECENGMRFAVAERMGINCRSNPACNNCRRLLALLRERSRFALRVTDTRARLPFGKELQVMGGGLVGLRRIMRPGDDTRRVGNIHALVREAQQCFGSLEALPYQDIVRYVVAFRPRRRHSVGPKR